MNNIRTEKIVLEIEWNCDSEDSHLNQPHMWDWKRIKIPMDIQRVKFIGIYKQSMPETADKWMGN